MALQHGSIERGMVPRGSARHGGEVKVEDRQEPWRTHASGGGTGRGGGVWFNNGRGVGLKSHEMR